MQNKPIISVISPSRNTGRFAKETIESILAQTYVNWEHIVIDGGSDDGTLQTLSRYPHIRWISQQGCGYEEAIRKGLNLARGEYIINCAISDGFLDSDWFKRCVEVLDADQQVSLVWGFGRYLSEDGKLGEISFNKFFPPIIPQKYDFFLYWLKKYIWMPEGNFCVRKEVLEKCFPDFKNFPEDHDPWFEFMFNFNSQGYLAYNIPVIAHFGRLHKGQRSQRENEKGLTPKRANAYIKRIKRYRRKILLGSITHIYRDGKHNILPVKFPRKEFCKDYVYFNAWRVIGRINKLYQGKI